MKRDPLRVALALVLIASAGLFLAGSIVERAHSAPAPTPASGEPATVSSAGEPSVGPASLTGTPSGLASQSSAQAAGTSAEGSAEHEAAEHGHRPASSASPSPATGASQAAGAPAALNPPAGQPPEGSPQREAAEKGERLFGLNLETPALIATATGVTLLLALAALAWRNRGVLGAIVAFALGFATLDVHEVLVRSGTGSSAIVALAGTLVVVHVAAAALALVAALDQGTVRQTN